MNTLPHKRRASNESRNAPSGGIPVRQVVAIALIAAALALVFASVGLYVAPLLNWPSILSGIAALIALAGFPFNAIEVRRHARNSAAADPQRHEAV